MGRLRGSVTAGLGSEHPVNQGDQFAGRAGTENPSSRRGVLRIDRSDKEKKLTTSIIKVLKLPFWCGKRQFSRDKAVLFVYN
jgi:hypothetical protein